MTIDLLPTIAKLCGARLPGGKPIDGKDILPLLACAPGASSPHEAYAFYWLRELHAVRAGRWKLHWPHAYPLPETPGAGGRPGKVKQRRIGKELFDLAADPHETRDVAAQHPDVVARLDALGERFRAELGDALREPPAKAAAK